MLNYIFNPNSSLNPRPDSATEFTSVFSKSLKMNHHVRNRCEDIHDIKKQTQTKTLQPRQEMKDTQPKSLNDC